MNPVAVVCWVSPLFELGRQAHMRFRAYALGWRHHVEHVSLPDIRGTRPVNPLFIALGAYGMALIAFLVVWARFPR